MTIESMLLDPRVVFGLWLIKGPIQTYTKFFSQEDADNPAINESIVSQNLVFSYKVTCENSEVEEYILKQLRRFWETGLSKALSALEWGYSGSQVMYKQDSKGQIHFDNLFKYKPTKIRPVSRQGGITGLFLRDRNQYIPIPKAFWHVHGREHNHFTGRSRLKGPHVPWHELWSIGGARDIRRLWYYKNSYDSGTLRYPEGSQTDEVCNIRLNSEVAAEIITNKLTGGFLVLTNKKDSGGKDYAWSYEPPSANITPQGLMEYPKDLKTEILEGMGIPPEVIESQGSSGFGSATGRKVPYMAFIASLTPLVTNVIGDFDTQILSNLVQLAFRRTVDYTIEPIVPVANVGDELTEFDNADPGNTQMAS